MIADKALDAAALRTASASHSYRENKGSIVDEVEGQIRELLVDFPEMPTVVLNAER